MRDLMPDLMQPIYDFGGEGQLLHFAVANGFPPETYIPLLRPFTARYHVFSLPPRALWPGEAPPQHKAQWNDTLAVDLLNGLREHGFREVIGMGHSFGAVATLLAAIAEPERFKAIILLDPTILPPDAMEKLAEGDPRNDDIGHLMAERAEKRQAHFPSVDEAYAYFKGKRLFADWPDETLRLYAESLRPSENDDGYTLAWPREWEAYYFRAFYTGTWQHIPALAQINRPILVLRGGSSDTFQPAAAAHMQSILPQAGYQEISGHGHLFPHSAPEATAAVIADWLKGSGL